MSRRLIGLACVLVLAGCGGGGTSGSATGTASGAEITPADVLAFVSINTDRESEQWQQADAVLRKFTIRDDLLRSANEGLSDTDVDFGRDVLPLLGDEIDLAVVGWANDEPQLVAMTQPTDGAKFNSLLERGADPSVHERVGDWTVFAETQAELDSFMGGSSAKLDDDGAFQAAMGELPDAANVKAYFNGERIIALLQQEAPEIGTLPAGQKIEWASLALSSSDDGLKLEGAAKTGGQSVQTYTPGLLAKVPSGSLVVASFHGREGMLQGIRDNPALAEQLAQLQSLLGITLEDIENVLDGEAVIYVRPGSPFPEVTAILQPKSASGAQATLDRLAGAASIFDPSLRVTRVTIGGNSVRKLNAGAFAAYWGIVDGNVVVSDSTAPFTGTSGSSIEDDAVFEQAREAVGAGDETAGFFYVNIKDSVPLIESFAQLAGEPLPPEVSEGLAPLQSFFLSATAEGDVGRFAALLQVR